MSEPPSYPPAPWHTHGVAYLSPHLVRTRDLTLPEGFEPLHIGPFTTGLLGYVRYDAPSPLLYDELVWMPCMVRCKSAGPRAKGWLVSVMYVNDNATLAGGREIWKLPKTLASFAMRPDGGDVRAEDGTELSLSLRAYGPKVQLRSAVTTLQWNDGATLCRFKGTISAQTSLADVSVTSFRSDAPAWMGFQRARRIPGLGAAQVPFDTIMEEPLFLPLGARSAPGFGAARGPIETDRARS